MFGWLFGTDKKEEPHWTVIYAEDGAVIGMMVQASFGIDIRGLAATDPADLLQGRELYRATGLQGVLESDFFAWPNEVGGNPLLQTLARRVARFSNRADSNRTAIMNRARSLIFRLLATT